MKEKGLVVSVPLITEIHATIEIFSLIENFYDGEGFGGICPTYY